MTHLLHGNSSTIKSYVVHSSFHYQFIFYAQLVTCLSKPSAFFALCRVHDDCLGIAEFGEMKVILQCFLHEANLVRRIESRSSRIHRS